MENFSNRPEPAVPLAPTLPPQPANLDNNVKSHNLSLGFMSFVLAVFIGRVFSFIPLVFDIIAIRMANQVLRGSTSNKADKEYARWGKAISLVMIIINILGVVIAFGIFLIILVSGISFTN